MLTIQKETHNRTFRSPEYNFYFNYSNGAFLRWGKTVKEDPKYSPFGPEIADIEITNKCNQGCKYCYKSNVSNGKNMSLDTFIKLIEKINVNGVLTQVAFGLGSTGEENPELWDMCKYLRSKYIAPNGTVANITDETADKIASTFGACAVSYHENKDMCYNSIEKLTKRNLKQTNMHIVIHESNYDEVLDVFNDITQDKRLKDLNAVVLLALKTKGRAELNNFKPLSQEKFNSLIEQLFKLKIKFGMDSCNSHKYMNFLNTTNILSEVEKKVQMQFIEPCESFAIFSSYFNVDGLYYPCSFAEGCMEGVDIFKYNDFVKDVWNGKIMTDLRNKSLSCNRKCLLYNI